MKKAKPTGLRLMTKKGRDEAWKDNLIWVQHNEIKMMRTQGYVLFKELFSERGNNEKSKE